MARKSRKGSVETPAVQEQDVVYNAAAYIRLSSDAKRKPGDSLYNQQDIIENFIAASPDIRLADIYIDNQATGTNFERPAFMRMLEDVESGRINCIIVKDLSRFGRNAIDCGYYIEKHLPALGVRFIAVTDSIDSLEGDGGVLLPLKNIIAESYALDISRKCRSVQRQNIQDGRFVGRMAPYGFAKSPVDCHRLVIDEEAAAIVRQIFDWAAGGMGVGEIIRELNEQSVLPPSHYKWEKGLITNKRLLGKPFWQKRTVTDILRDRVYVGDMAQGKSQTVNGKGVSVPRDEWICVPNTHEPVVSRELFERLQDVLRQTSEKDEAVRSAASSYSPHIFKGKVFCAHCGHPMHRHRQNKDGTYWYRCESQWKYHKGACYQVSVKEEEIKVEVFALLRKHVEAILGRHIRIERVTPVKNAAAETELMEINRKLASSGHFLKSLYENMVAGLINAEEFTAMKTDYEGKITALSKRADQIRTQRRERATEQESYRGFADAASDALSSKELNADAINCLVERIQVQRDKSFEILLRFKDEFREVKRVG
ncbi:MULTISPECIES: recombinase family protein [Dehalobacter]|uniref:recombinase family protein n=1 Tax=Dehalobacter TaxID=56112 RepID=UPI00258E31F8|nr:recombinase family protein [Dehalobacter sp.]MDJ0304456.1 recombinase family protein [Dehalobacter sp.]